MNNTQNEYFPVIFSWKTRGVVIFVENAGSALDQLVTSTFPLLILFLGGALVFSQSCPDFHKISLVFAIGFWSIFDIFPCHIIYMSIYCCRTKIERHRYFNINIQPITQNWFNINIQPISQNWWPSLLSGPAKREISGRFGRQQFLKTSTFNRVFTKLDGVSLFANMIGWHNKYILSPCLILWCCISNICQSYLQRVKWQFCLSPLHIACL